MHWSTLAIGGQLFETAHGDVTGRVLAALQKPLPAAGRPAPGGPPARRFGLQRLGKVWQVFFDWEPSSFPHTTGTTYIEHYLKHPGEPVHPVALLARLQGEDPVQQRSAALDDAEDSRHYLRQMQRLRAVIQNETTSEAERKVAEEELAQLEGAKAYIHHHTFDNAARATKSVRQAVHRTIGFLEEARDEGGRPNRVLLAFAAHLRQYLLGPSQSGDAPAGHLVYEPPPGVTWI